MIKEIIQFSQTNPNVELSDYDMKRIKDNQGNPPIAIIRGVGLTVKGWQYHECDCPYCEKDYIDISEDFTNVEEANKYIEREDIQDAEIVENTCYFVKAVVQEPANFGLLENISATV